MTANQKKKAINYLLLVILISLILSIWGSKIDAKPIAEWVKGVGILAPAVYVILLTIPSIIAPLSGSPIFIAGYILFGSWVQILAYMAFLLSSIINYYIARRWGRRLVIKLVGKEDMAKVDTFTKDYGIATLVFLRLLQGPFSDYISYAYGFTNIKFVPYMIVNFLTPIPWILLWHFYIFPVVNTVGDFSLWFLITLIPILIISWLLWKYKFKNK